MLISACAFSFTPSFSPQPTSLPDDNIMVNLHRLLWFMVMPVLVESFTFPRPHVVRIRVSNVKLRQQQLPSLQLLRGGHNADNHVAGSPSLSPAQLASSFSTIVIVAAILKSLGLKSQANRIISASFRMSVQLSLIGACMSPLFAFTSSSPWKLTAWVMFIAAVASKEAVARSKYTYKRQFVDSFLSILGGVGLTLLHLLAFVLGRRSLVKINAQTVIPIAGMLFGNALTAASLTKSILLQNYLEDFDRVELRLSRGASFWEGSLPVIRDAVEAALAPTINAMAATGIIFLPGMMTGQILGGQPPLAASGYQVMIYFAIGASSCLTAILMSLIVTSGIYGIKDSIERASGKQKQSPVIERSLQLHSNSPTVFEKAGTDTILEVKNLTLPSTNLTIPSFIIEKHSRIGVVGRSGVGKTRLLRALSKLEDSEGGEIYLNGLTSNSFSISKWRSRVMWISQDRPTLSGSPMDLYESILGYTIYRKQQKIDRLNPIEIASSWNLSEKAWYQPWSSLSGGEAQRANLAIALALQPDVLLLDEPTSNCDTATTISIEKTLRELNLTTVIVSHSEEQIKRTCTSRIELQETLISG